METVIPVYVHEWITSWNVFAARAYSWVCALQSFIHSLVKFLSLISCRVTAVKYIFISYWFQHIHLSIHRAQKTLVIVFIKVISKISNKGNDKWTFRVENCKNRNRGIIRDFFFSSDDLVERELFSWLYLPFQWSPHLCQLASKAVQWSKGSNRCDSSVCGENQGRLQLFWRWLPPVRSALSEAKHAGSMFDMLLRCWEDFAPFSGQGDWNGQWEWGRVGD